MSKDISPTEITDSYLKGLDEAQLRKVWANVPSVQQEFTGLETFLSYALSLQEGRTRRCQATPVITSTEAEGRKYQLAN